MASIELQTTAMAVGGEALGRDENGRVVFVTGALPGERVKVELSQEKSSFARGQTVEVMDPSPDRVAAPCRHVTEGCGGCNWQHIQTDAQRKLRVGLVTEVLQRQAGVHKPVVVSGPKLAEAGLRTTIRGAVMNGRFAYRKAKTNDPVRVDECLIAHPLLHELISEGRFGAANEVTLRVGARTGERMAVLDPSAEGVQLPGDVTVIGTDALKANRRAWIHEQAVGKTWRVSAQSFFQSSPEGADALVGVAGELISEFNPDKDAGQGSARPTMVDLCCGVGLFAGTVGRDFDVIGVERSHAAVADAKVNLADTNARIVASAVERWRASKASVVVADPARNGLGKPGVGAVTKTTAPLVVLVSCDIGAFGRDAKLLREAGYEPRRSVVLDLFAHTDQAEVVTAFTLR